jgi:hypothetical protein
MDSQRARGSGIEKRRQCGPLQEPWAAHWTEGVELEGEANWEAVPSAPIARKPHSLPPRSFVSVSVRSSKRSPIHGPATPALRLRGPARHRQTPPANHRSLVLASRKVKKRHRAND